MSEQHSHANRRLARATFIVMAGYLAAKVSGIGREIIVARTFGAVAELDAYYAAFNIPDLIFTLIAGGALATAFIPVLAEYVSTREREAVWRLIGNVLTVVFLLTALLAGVVALVAPWLVRVVVAPGFDAAQQHLTVALMRLILLSTLIFSVSGLFMGVLNTFQHFLLPAFAPVMYNLGIIFGALVLSPRMAPEKAIFGLAWGVVIGAALHAAIQVPGLWRYGVRIRPHLALHDRGLRDVLRLMGPRVLALGVIKLNWLVVSNLESRLEEGSLAALTFAWHLVQVPETIFASALATALFPTLAHLAGQGDLAGLRRTFETAMRLILLLTIPTAAGLWILGRALVQTVYEGGAFTAAATDAVTIALRFYALGLVGHSALEVVARTFYARKDTLTPLWMALIAMVGNVALALLLLRSLGHGGLALANSAAVTLEVALGVWWLRGRVGGDVVGGVVQAAVRVALATAGMVAVLVVFHTAVPTWPAWGLLLAGSVVGVVAFAAVGVVVGLHTWLSAFGMRLPVGR
ncbi:murein biosynthesis integral membrane protein MurJ [Ardenticatena maritima]|uniref:murein biosynthesis integral membrane protein MurJ n=2 Tax=Ardenticatena maritima TaxID=872965 RepID=UPI0007619566|nr:murein biosynthesis integral membrane protein MurJ [Ardenticatena maritima]